MLVKQIIISNAYNEHYPLFVVSLLLLSLIEFLLSFPKEVNLRKSLMHRYYIDWIISILNLFKVFKVNGRDIKGKGKLDYT